MWSKHSIPIAFLSLGFLLSLQACAKSHFAPEASPTTKNRGFPTATNPCGCGEGMNCSSLDVRWLTGPDIPYTEDSIYRYLDLMNAYNASNDCVNLTLEIVPFKNAYSYLTSEIRNGNGPDIVGPIGLRASNRFADQWLDLTTLFKQKKFSPAGYYDPAILELFLRESGGQMTGLPISIDPTVLFYNKAHFTQAGLTLPPAAFGDPYRMPDGNLVAWDMATLLDVSKRLTKDQNGNKPGDPAFNPGAISRYGLFSNFTDLREMINIFGPGSLVDNGAKGIQMPGRWRAGLHWLYDAVWMDHVFPDLNHTAVMQDLYGNPFASGNVAMMIARMSNATELYAEGAPGYGITAVPAYGGSSTASAEIIAFRILKDSHVQSEAYYPLIDIATNLSWGWGYRGITIFSGGTVENKIKAFNARFDENEMDWNMMMGILEHSDFKSWAVPLPNEEKAQNRLTAFLKLIFTTPGLELDAEIDQLLADLMNISYPPNKKTPAKTNLSN